MSMWSIPPAEGIEVLALDENGQAGAWVKSYGGELGTGFVMLGYGPGEIDPAIVRTGANYRPGRAAK